MPQFLYCLRPVRLGMLTDRPTPDEAQTIQDHFAYLEQLTRQGVVLMAGRTLTADESTFGLVVLIARSEQEARALMQDDPAVQRGVMRAELYPFRVALWSASGPGGDPHQ